HRGRRGPVPRHHRRRATGGRLPAAEPVPRGHARPDGGGGPVRGTRRARKGPAPALPARGHHTEAGRMTAPPCALQAATDEDVPALLALERLCFSQPWT